jgi:iron complex outermembrane receptor protein
MTFTALVDRTHWRVSAFLIAVVVSTAGPALAGQPATGTLRGVVTDSSGAVVSGASVTLTVAGGEERRTTTDSRGGYVLAGLPAGEYELAVEWPGFATATEAVTVTGSTTIDRDITLLAAPVEQRVTVTFVEPRTSVGVKQESAVRDLPLVTTSYSASFMSAIDAHRVDDLFAYMTGVTRAGDTAFDFTIRGARAREPNNVLIDGMPGLASRFGSPAVINVERVEVLRGPASAAYGQIQPGGVINIVTKQPVAERHGLLAVKLGSFGGAGAAFGNRNVVRAEGDFSGRIDGSARWLYRLAFSYDDASSFRQSAGVESLVLAPALTWAPSSKSLLSIQMEYRRDRSSLDDGLAAPANDISRVAARSVRYQEPGDVQKEDGGAAHIRFVRAISARTSANVSWRSVANRGFVQGYENVMIGGRDGVTLMRRDREQHTRRRYHYGEGSLKTTIATGAVRHDLVAGGVAGYELREPDRRSFVGGAALGVNLYNPVFGAPRPPRTPGFHRVSDLYNYGVFVHDQLALSPRWKAMLAVRRDWQETDYEDLRSTDARSTSTSAWSPMAGVVFQPDTRWSVFASYTTSFSPAMPEWVDEQGRSEFAPERGRQLETGARTTLLGGRADVSASVYRLRRTDVLNQLGGGVTSQSGEELVDGVELESRARLAGGLEVMAGYAYTDARVTKDDSAFVIGSRVVNVPRHSANLWTKYDLQQGALRGLGVGIGFSSRDRRAGSRPLANGSVLVLPGFTRADAAIYFARGAYDVSLRIANVSDARFYESALSAISIQPGAPRQVLLSLRSRF